MITPAHPNSRVHVVRVVLRHLSGARATEVDSVPLGPHRELVIGRAHSAAVRFDPCTEPEVGRYHARLEVDPVHPGLLTVADLGSRNGTYVNGGRISGRVTVLPGDVLRLGPRGPEIELGFEHVALIRSS